MMKKAYSAIKAFNFSEGSAPWILLVACFLGFGIFIPQLGYYQDDWAYVFNHFSFGNTGIHDFLYYDGRPFAAWIYDVGFDILGYRPVLWHLSVLIIKWLTATFLWLVFRTIWPDKPWRNLTAALVFSLYPFFTLQPLAVAYSIHWVGYLLYSLSIYFMLLSLRKQFWVFTFLSILTQILCLFTLEYFAGIDLLRPIFLWLAFRPPTKSVRQKITTTFKLWGPYLIAFAVYFVWRGFIYEAPAGRNSPIELLSILRNPFSSLLAILSTAIPDLVLVLISSWYKILDPAAFDFSISINRNSFLVSALSFFLFLYFLSHLATSKEGNSFTGSREMLIVGLLALLLGLLPTYAGGYVIYTKLPPWNSRFSLGSLFGAALIITALIDMVVRTPWTRWVIISTLLGLLVGWHLRSTNDFRWGWDKQVNFYRQLYLRAPSLAPGTALLSDEEFLVFMGNFSTSYGINLIYQSKEQQGESKAREANYWLFTYADFSTELGNYLNGESFSIGTDREAPRAGIKFQGASKGSVVMTFTPENGQCLWIIRPEYAASKILSEPTRQLAPLSYTSRILPGPQNEDSFLFQYLYPNLEQDWCYYYEKADLAYQYEDWQKAIELWEAAQKQGLQPENGFEYLPFIEAFARTSDWETAKKLTHTSQKTMQGIDSLLCDIWSGLDKAAPFSPEKKAMVSSVKEDLRCDQE